MFVGVGGAPAEQQDDERVEQLANGNFRLPSPRRRRQLAHPRQELVCQHNKTNKRTKKLRNATYTELWSVSNPGRADCTRGACSSPNPHTHEPSPPCSCQPHRHSSVTGQTLRRGIVSVAHLCAQGAEENDDATTDGLEVGLVLPLRLWGGGGHVSSCLCVVDIVVKHIFVLICDCGGGGEQLVSSQFFIDRIILKIDST